MVTNNSMKWSRKNYCFHGAVTNWRHNQIISIREIVRLLKKGCSKAKWRRNVCCGCPVLAQNRLANILLWIHCVHKCGKAHDDKLVVTCITTKGLLK